MGVNLKAGAPILLPSQVLAHALKGRLRFWGKVAMGIKKIIGFFSSAMAGSGRPCILAVKAMAPYAVRERLVPSVCR